VEKRNNDNEEAPAEDIVPTEEVAFLVWFFVQSGLKIGKGLSANIPNHFSLERSLQIKFIEPMPFFKEIFRKHP
jgi:hypothetical protein